MQTSFKIVDHKRSPNQFFKNEYGLFILFFVLLIASCKKENMPSQSQDTAEKSVVEKTSSPLATVSVFSTGFNNPRGLKFGPDGYLYVAEAGTGVGTTLSCPERSPDEPYMGSPVGGRISKVSPLGLRSGGHVEAARLLQPTSRTGDIALQFQRL